MMYPYENAELSPKERAADLLGRMDIKEKMGQVEGFYFQSIETMEMLEKLCPYGAGNVSCLEMRSVQSLEECARLQQSFQKRIMELSPHHIPAIFHMEGVCGAYLQGAASFPSGLGRASSWDPELEQKIGAIVGRQERAVGITQTLAPVLDISRDSRMGRQGETYGEDPVLVSAMGVAFTKGLQENGTEGRHTEAVAKHFLGFHASQAGIHGADCEISSHTLLEIYGKPFQAAIKEAGLRGIMPCYCAINGEPVSASKYILTNLLREQMGFDGITVSDYGAIRNIHTVQKLCDSEAEAGLRAMESGMDMELQYKMCYGDEMERRFTSGEADVAILDRAVMRILEAKFRMGLFEHPYAFSGRELEGQFYGEKDEETALQAARESLILLKNDGILPLSPKIRKIAVIGWHASTARALYGGYTHFSMAEGLKAAVSTMAGLQTGKGEGAEAEHIPGTKIQKDNQEWDSILRHQNPSVRSLLEELCTKTGAEVVYAEGYSFAGDDCSGFAQALEIAADADVVVLTLGGKYGTGSIASTGEGIDAVHIGLPVCQEKFLQELKKLGKAAVGIHFDGRPISSDVAESCLNAIVEAWAPAQGGARAIVELLTGKWNPSGKMPVSVAYTAGQIPIYYNHLNGSSYHQAESIAFHEYVDMTHKPRYAFGYGLSYTRFVYESLSVEKKEVGPNELIRAMVSVHNAGDRDGDEIIQLYVKDPYASMIRPAIELAGFARVHVKAGEKKKVEFEIHPSQFAFLDYNGNWIVEKGEYDLYAGPDSETLPLKEDFLLTESAFIAGNERSFYAKII